jgi:hypothetical protein
MATLVIDSSTPMDALLSFMGAKRLAVEKDAGRVSTIAPVINPDDYDNDTDYLNAIPGMMESIMASINAPKSERVSAPEDWIDRSV